MKRCIFSKLFPLWFKCSTFSFFQNTLPVALTLILFNLPVAAQAQVQSDDFDDSDDTFPLEWAHYDPIGDFISSPRVTWTYVTNGSGDVSYRIATEPTPDAQLGAGRGASLLTNVAYTTFYSSVDIAGWDTNKDSAFGLLARIDTPGLGTTVGYSFTYQSDDEDVQISRITGEAPTEVTGTLKDIILNPTKRYRFVFQGSGDRLEGRIYDLDDLATPLIIVQGTDATYSSGFSGLVVYDNGSNNGTTGADAVYDNFLSSGAPSFVPCENPIVVSDDFNGGNDNGWIRYLTDTNGNALLTNSADPSVTSTWTVTNGGYRLTCPAGTNSNFSDVARVASFRVDGPEIADFVVSADLIDWDNSLTERMGVVARVQTPIATPNAASLADIPKCYALVYANRSSSFHGGTDQLRIYKLGPGQIDFIRGIGGEIGDEGQFCCGSPSRLGASASPLPSGNYRLVFKGIGNLLMGQIIDLGTGLPMTFWNGVNGLTNTVWANDYRTNSNPIYTSGHVGLITFFGDGASPPDPLDATFDNLCATEAAPSITITPNGGMLDISWSANQEGIWVLDSSPDLATWTEVPFSALTFASGNLTYSAPATGNSFFRLRRI